MIHDTIYFLGEKSTRMNTKEKLVENRFFYLFADL